MRYGYQARVFFEYVRQGYKAYPPCEVELYHYAVIDKGAMRYA